MKLVMKFGGSSVADVEKMRRRAKLVKARTAAGDRVVTVVSALDGMTEELLALADAAGASNRPAMDARLKEIRRRHEELAKAAGDAALVAPQLDQLDHLALGISAVGELTARFPGRLSQGRTRKRKDAAREHVRFGGCRGAGDDLRRSLPPSRPARVLGRAPTHRRLPPSL